MLSRVADNLFWIARYMERAENMARILEVADRMAMSPSQTGVREGNEWHSAIIISGCEEPYFEKHGEPAPQPVVRFLALDRDNPSSIRSCIDTARRNAREIRTALTTEMWEALNSAWLEMESFNESWVTGARRHQFLTWVKERSLLFQGAVTGTMLRSDGYAFNRIGTYIERGDNTARILDVKYHILLPSTANVGGGLDYYQWASILRAASAYVAYNHIYRTGFKPWLVAELLILREEMPRSLINCLKQIKNNLDGLSTQYGFRHECHRLAGQFHSQLAYSRIDDVFQRGLHEFITDFVGQNVQLSDEISKAYLD